MGELIGRTPHVLTKTLTTQDTEYELVLPMGVSRFRVQARANDVRMAYIAGKVANASTGIFFTIKAAQPPYEQLNVRPDASRTLYFASSTNSAVVEVECWE